MLETAISIAKEAGVLLKKGQSDGFSTDRKSSTIDLVTECDRAAETLIVGRLREAFPDHGIVGEEGSSVPGSSAEDYHWYVDPLDGTNNFAHGIPHFAVSMGLFRGDEPILAVLCDPMRGDLYHAEKGKGAYRNDARLKVSKAPSVGEAILASGFPYDRHTDPVDNIAQMALFLKKCQGFRRFGAAALDLAMVASGSLDGFWEFKLSSWDIAAGVLLVTEAGGRVTRIDGSPMGHLTEKIHLVASNGLVHQEMLDVLKPSLTSAHLKTGPAVPALR